MSETIVRFVQVANGDFVVFGGSSGPYEIVRCEEGPLAEFFRVQQPLLLKFVGVASEREHELKEIVVETFKKVFATVDLDKSLVHPAIMRDKVEAIQRESFRERDRASTSFMRRSLGLEEGDATAALTRYYEHEFRLQRAKDIEDAIVAGRADEASLDLRSIGPDALTWAGWMIAARLFPAARQAQ
jgi:hypothetical protein